ncbi:MAG TPA: hypothetical protein VFV02_07285 [Acidimicrobiales bacterium]|nr:hypothetical protein [Acidimicrobiales bacterium]
MYLSIQGETEKTLESIDKIEDLDPAVKQEIERAEAKAKYHDEQTREESDAESPHAKNLESLEDSLTCLQQTKKFLNYLDKADPLSKTESLLGAAGLVAGGAESILYFGQKCGIVGILDDGLRDYARSLRGQELSSTQRARLTELGFTGPAKQFSEFVGIIARTKWESLMTTPLLTILNFIRDGLHASDAIDNLPDEPATWSHGLRLILEGCAIAMIGITLFYCWPPAAMHPWGITKTVVVGVRNMCTGYLELFGT